VQKKEALRSSSIRMWQQALLVCPPDIESRIHRLPEPLLNQMEELRFRLGQPLQVCGQEVEGFLHKTAGLTTHPEEALVVTAEHLARVVQVITQSSLYAVEDELRRGFITMQGGHRVGVAGRVLLQENGWVKTIRSITSVNVRIAKEHIGAANPLLPYLYRKLDGRPYSVLFLSSPQCGKTTLLRDVARQWSCNRVRVGKSVKVSIIDERSEISGCLDGIPQFDLGPRTDVLDACPKAEGMLMAIRSLSPDIVVTDEIGRKDDRDAVLEATHAGVSVLTTAHAGSLQEWRNRPFMSELFEARAFSRYILLSRRHGPGTVESVLDESGRPLMEQRAAGKGMDVP
jgi:stage III sporulation protein AA